MKLSHKNRARHERRRDARQVRKAMLTDKSALRVISPKKGEFRLAIAVGTLVKPFGQTFAKQGDAVKRGQEKFGVKARRLLNKAA